jgi:hypothetical protein
VKAKAQRQREFADDQLVAAVESFASEFPDERGRTTSLTVLAGSLFHGGDPVVKANPQYFIDSNATSAERRQRLIAANPGVLPRSSTHVTGTTLPQPAWSPPEDLVVCHKPGAGARLGQQLPRDSEAVRANPECFRPVWPEGLDRADARIAQATMTHSDPEGEVPLRTVYEGEWLHRDDIFCRLHPHFFTTPMGAEQEPRR